MAKSVVRIDIHKFARYKAAYLLLDLSVCEYIFERDVEFSHVVLSKPVLVPANTFEERDPDDW